MAPRAAALLALAAVVACAACVSPAAAIAQLCNPGLTPAQPTNVRTKSNVYNGKSAEIVISWDNPTTEKTGCVQQFRVEYLGGTKAWQTIDTPIQSPVSYKFLANPGEKVTFKVAAYNKQADKYSSYTSLSSGTVAASPPTGVSPGGPIKICTPNVVPPTPTNFKVKSNVYNAGTKNSEILLEWTTTTDPNAGCIKQFDVQSYVSNGGMKDSLPATPGQTTYTKLRLLKPGQQASFEVWSVGQDGKVSGKAKIASVTGSPGTTTATPYGRKML